MSDPRAQSGRSAHSILVLAPIGCWLTGLALDIASHFSADPAHLVRTATWLTGSGLIGALVAGVAGMVVAAPIPTGTPASRRVLVHVGLVMTLLVLYPFGLILRLAVETGRPAAPSTIAISAAGVLVVSITAWTGRAVRRSRCGSRSAGRGSRHAGRNSRADSQP